LRPLLGLLTLAAAIALFGAACTSGSANATSQTVGIRYSLFEPGLVTVPQGVPITFTLQNDDPIEHEWIIGKADVHESHRTGTEPFHSEIPSEVTIPALSTRQTAITFDQPGEYAFICHLPGHEAYGMVGAVQVVASGS
jgi:uncharacterized cupredoxin-like copper-binding protein